MRLFRVFIPKSTVALIAFDLLILVACIVGAVYLVRGDEAEIYLRYEDGIFSVAAAVLSMMAGLYFQDLYTDFRVRSRILLVQQVILLVGIAFITQAVLAYVRPGFMLPRWAALIGCSMVVAALPVWRIAYSSVIYKGLGIERVLFLGTDTIGQELALRLSERPELGLSGIGFIDDSLAVGETVSRLPVLGRLADLQHVVAEFKPNRIVICLAEQRRALPVNELLDLRFSGTLIDEAVRLYEMAFGRVSVRRLRPSQLIFSSELGPQRSSMRIQAVYSFIIGLIGLVLVFPVMLVVAAAIKLTSPGPVLFRQTRVGLNGAVFTLYKFRSMVADAESKTGAVWATRQDPRVTKIGRFLRKTRLDELPQLFNVLRGEMSVVGPRPERPEFVTVLSEQIPFYRQRHCVKPGVTGWAQINYKYGETIEDTIIKLEYDLYYIKNLSPSLDAYIMFHTAKVMLFSQHGQ